MADEQDELTKPRTPGESKACGEGYIMAAKAHSRAVPREKDLNWVGAVGIMATAIVGVKVLANSDPLSPILKPDAQVSPDRLAEQIVKDPKAYSRFRDMKSFVDKLNQQVEAKSRARFEGGGVE